MRRSTFKAMPVKKAVGNDTVVRSYDEGSSVSGRTVRGNIYVRTVYGRDLFDDILSRFGKTGWNLFAERLEQHSLSGICSNPSLADKAGYCEPIYMEVDLSGGSFEKMDLSGLNMSDVRSTKADFTGSNLAGSILGAVEGAVFRDANLTRAEFNDDISGVDFTGADTKHIRLSEAKFRKRSPPIGLSPALMKRIRPFPAHWDMDGGSQPKDTGKSIKPISTTLCSVWGEMT